MEVADKHSRAAWDAACKGGGGEGGAADRGGAGRWEEGVGNGCGCLSGACVKVLNLNNMK